MTAVIADGAMRDSLSIMDRCIGISRDIDADVVRKAAGLAQKDYLFSLSSACINKNVQKALSIIDKLHGESMDMARLCAELIDHFRNFMLIKTVRNPREMIVMNDDEFEQAQSQCDYVSLADIVYFMDVLQRSAERMGKSSSNRTEIETAFVKLTSPELDMSQEALTARLVKLEKAVNMGGFSQVSNTTQTNNTSNREDIEKSDLVNKKEENSVPDRIEETPQQNNTPVFPNMESTSTANDLHNKLEEMRSRLAIKEEETKSQLDDQTVSDNPPSVPFPTLEDRGAPVQEKAPVRRNPVNLEEIYANAEPFLRWQEVVENLKEYSRPIAASFDNTDAYVSGDYLLIDAKTDIPFNLLKRSPEQKDRIRDAVQEMTGKRYKLGPYKPPVKKQEKTDPLVTFAQKLRDNGVDVTEE